MEVYLHSALHIVRMVHGDTLTYLEGFAASHCAIASHQGSLDSIPYHSVSDILQTERFFTGFLKYFTPVSSHSISVLYLAVTVLEMRTRMDCTQ
jgi:hypothetical protein